MTTVIVDYGSGNLHSAAKAFERAAGGGRVEVTGDSRALSHADRIVLPGVGAFGDCAAGLRALPGMVEALEENVVVRGKPFLGICVGMQLMGTHGLESGVHPGLGWVKGEVRAIECEGQSWFDGLKLGLPHMGWNDLRVVAPSHPVLAGIDSGAHVYFVHSYRLVPAESSDVLAEVDYGGPVAAVIGHDNMVGTQFHPEKSQAVGLRLIANFLAWHP